MNTLFIPLADYVSRCKHDHVLFHTVIHFEHFQYINKKERWTMGGGDRVFLKEKYSAILDTSLVYKTIYTLYYTISITLPANYNSIKTSHWQLQLHKNDQASQMKCWASPLCIQPRGIVPPQLPGRPFTIVQVKSTGLCSVTALEVKMVSATGQRTQKALKASASGQTLSPAEA